MNQTQDLSIVYDMTRRCPWECSICCMGAVNGLEALEGELPQSRKLALIDEAASLDRNARIDFSGGEIFTDLGNLEVIEYAGKVLGRDRVGISCSGYRIDDRIAQRLSQAVSECEMTMDVPPGKDYALRPRGYAIAAARALPHLQRYGITTGIQTVLASSNINEENLTQLYQWLCENRVDNWSLLRFFPQGRGANYRHECLSEVEELRTVQFIQKLDKSNLSSQKPRVDFHYTMKGHDKYTCECRCVRKSIGIMPDGQVTACFWAVDANTGIIDPKYLLGSLQKNTLGEILSGRQACYWNERIHRCELERHGLEHMGEVIDRAALPSA